VPGGHIVQSCRYRGPATPRPPRPARQAGRKGKAGAPLRMTSPSSSIMRVKARTRAMT